MNNNQEYNNYWIEREMLLEEDYEKDIKKVLKLLKSYYLKAYKDIKVEVQAYHAVGNTYSEIQAQETMIRIKAIINSLFDFQFTTLKDSMQSRYISTNLKVLENLTKFGFIPQAPAINFNVPDIKVIEILLREKSFGHTVMSRNVMNKDKMIFQIESTVIDGLIRGDSHRKIANALNKNIGTGYKNCERLVRTEVKRASDKAKLDTYKENGIQQYKIYTAHDTRVCEICKRNDGRIVDIDKAIPGRDYCFHPFERCVLLPIIPEDD